MANNANSAAGQGGTGSWNLPVPALTWIRHYEARWLRGDGVAGITLAAYLLLAAVETAAIGRMFTAKHGDRLDANQEFLALAAANLTAGLGRGFPISGGMSQSLVNEAGAQEMAQNRV